MNRTDIWMLMQAQKATLSENDKQESRPKRLISYLTAIGLGVITIALIYLG